MDFEIGSELLDAIRGQYLGDVDFLLTRGANPDGFHLSSYEMVQGFFLRFRPKEQDINIPRRADLLAAIRADSNPAQTAYITEEEVEDRWGGEEFWTQSSPGVNFQGQEPIHPLLVAARLDSTAIVDRLLASNSDCSFWIADPPMREIPEPPTPSALAFSSPVHKAIASDNNAMLSHLLAREFSPNTLPLGDVRKSITPLMATFLNRNNKPWNEAAYAILARDPRIDFDLRSPFMLVHILHIATAHSLAALQRVERIAPLSHADTTAYGHTLLHIACLPTLIQRYASKVQESIRAMRCHYSSAPTTMAECEAELSPQLELIQYLVASGTQSVAAYDTDLNTPLHYLASARVINEEAIEFLRAQPQGEVTWTEWRNWYGYTAEELWEQAHRKRVQIDSWYGGTTRRVATMPTLRLRW
ncbi:hypothetical protein BO78DRAFT_395439 [Aspergillus sclerotiicarbonarius CBS 121057]|uniref:Ankyrin n=1 Tax=Aspergillus sclerotiicarbonarius (strain CBS 121057 / IBT 28362) TaxID=1448318 RepID=A0A319EGW6_ASPSB|nr:hypothetical protein BO78DRAFT_395439 [Aspergillus sclerotiicarbonarius CBS 121057]